MYHNLALEDMQIVSEHTRTYPLIGRTFKAFTIWTQDLGHFQDFELLVEVESGVVEPDVKVVAAQEQAVRSTWLPTAGVSIERSARSKRL